MTQFQKIPDPSHATFNSLSEAETCIFAMHVLSWRRECISSKEVFVFNRRITKRQIRRNTGISSAL